jgi:hypothetical protein
MEPTHTSHLSNYITVWTTHGNKTKLSLKDRNTNFILKIRRAQLKIWKIMYYILKDLKTPPPQKIKNKTILCCELWIIIINL